MTVETATFISQLNPTYPTAGDPKSEGDDHIRLTKGVLQSQFTNLGTTAVTATASELNATVGRSADIAAISGAATTGAPALLVVTQSTSDTSQKAANSALVDAKILAASLSSTLPSQTGNAGKTILTDGTNASWGYPNDPNYSAFTFGGF